MKWRFINSGFSPGKNNMEKDLLLANNCKRGEAVFRLYRWRPYCISLGANQSEDIINLDETKKYNIDFVKRPTGGRAILHAEEITYSVIFPINFNMSARELYYQINSALKKGLERYNNLLKDIQQENNQPDFLQLYKNNAGSICFAASAKNELKYKGKKLVGSAQRKFKNVILQHGSVLCGSMHKDIINYLNISEGEKLIFRSKLNENTIDLEEILNEDINYIKLCESLFLGFREFFNINLLRPELEIVPA
jgi:lipoyl(octanoyl) transferase